MKKLILLVTALVVSTLSFSQTDTQWIEIHVVDPSFNLDVYNQKDVDKYHSNNKPDKWGGNIAIGLGGSPSHPRLFAQVNAGISYRYVEVSTHLLPGISDDGIHVYSAGIGYRIPITKMFTAKPSINYWTIWDGEHKIDWVGGNRLMYAIDLAYRIHNDLNILVTASDYRSKNNSQSHLNGMKILTFGLQYLF